MTFNRDDDRFFTDNRHSTDLNYSVSESLLVLRVFQPFATPGAFQGFSIKNAFILDLKNIWICSLGEYSVFNTQQVVRNRLEGVRRQHKWPDDR